MLPVVNAFQGLKHNAKQVVSGYVAPTSGPPSLVPVHLHVFVVTNDFPPKVGGIQSYLWELWRRLPPDDVTVMTTPYAGGTAWGAITR